MTAAELIEHAGTGEWITPALLHAWLVGSGLAQTNGEPDRLLPTPLAVGLVEALGHF